VRLRWFAESAVPDRLRGQVLDLLDETWPPAQPSDRRWPVHDPALGPDILLLLDGDRVLASLAVLRSPLQHAGQRFAVGGLSSVVTRSDSRRQGLGRQLVAEAHRGIAADGLDLAVFTCDRHLRAFYEDAGWKVLPGAVLVGGTRAAPLRSDAPQFDKVTMADFFSARARAARDRFASADVELYPGDIDRLW
jgi:GNAT superfamily N-acetyltransferase